MGLFEMLPARLGRQHFAQASLGDRFGQSGANKYLFALLAHEVKS